MGFVHNIEMSLDGEVDVEELRAFIDAVPPTGRLSTTVIHEIGDWHQSDKLKVTLKAQWLTP